MTMVWDVNPILFQKGFFMLRWYGICFTAAFMIALPFWHYMFAKAGKAREEAERLTTYIAIGVMAGARLGHVIFYDWSTYKHNLIAIFSPIVFSPEFQIVGFSGLASHGAAIGIVVAIFFYIKRISIALVPPRIRLISRRPAHEFLWILDHLVILFALGGACIRIGNFMNSEIIGKPTQKNYGVVFAREVREELSARYAAVIQTMDFQKETTCALPIKKHYQPLRLTLSFKEEVQDEEVITRLLQKLKKDLVRLSYVDQPMIYEPYETALSYELIQRKPNVNYQVVVHTSGILRHPTQLYEALSCFCIFILSFIWWYTKRQVIARGCMFGTFMLIIPLFRFFHEFYKEYQVAFEQTMWLNMGQLLSLPWMLIGLFLILRSVKLGHTGVIQKKGEGL
ncbi:MAG: prolipoprotein diacylglyceryl transferase [Candidatus Cardinium sp.]|nr:prolipoprotein diacylglyceryl transferase [Candidatus Cardinium sp.]